jgi:hypothetical protein
MILPKSRYRNVTGQHAKRRVERLTFWMVFLVVAIASAFLQIQPFAAPQDRFIGHSDQADLALLARNIAEGKGAVVDCVWILHDGGLPGKQVTHPEPYWSVYVAALWAPFFRIFGATLQTTMLVGALVKTGIAAIGSFWTFRLTKSWCSTYATAAFLLLHPKMVVRVQPLSDIYLTFGVMSAISAAILWWTRRSVGWAFLSGIMAGWAIGSKPSGMLLLVLIPTVALLRGDRWQNVKESWAAVLGLVLALAPLGYHNYQSYGTLYWPALPIIRSEGLERDDTPINVGIPRAVKRYLDGVLDGGLGPQWLLPILFHAFVGMVIRFIHLRGRCRGTWFTLVASTFLLMCAGFCQSLNVRIEWRYWNFITPLAVVTTMIACDRLSQSLVWFALAYSLFIGVDSIWKWQKQEFKPIPTEYSIIADLIPEDAVVMTQNPWELSFHTRRRSVSLPYSENEQDVQELVDRFGIEYLVLIKREQPYARLPYFEKIVNGELPSWLEQVFYDENLLIARFRPGNWTVHSND